MKKYVMLCAFTVIMIATVLISGQMIKNTRVKVTTVKITACTAEDTVTCTGKVESLAGNNVYSLDSGYAEKIYVKPGDKVTAGQPLMEILADTSSAVASSSSSSTYNSAFDAYEAYLKNSKLPSSVSSENSSLPSSDSNSNEKSQTSILKAPTSGVVQSIAVSAAGSYINAKKPAVVLQNENSVQVRLSVDESQIADLKTGQKVQISGVGFKNSTYFGKVESISSEAKQLVTATGGQETVVEVIASVKNPGADIKPGFTAKAKITTSNSNNVIIVPYEAVREDVNGNEYVFVLKNGKAKRTPVITGKELDSGFEIKSGVQTKDSVITNPDDVCDGSEVIPTPGEKS